MSAPESSSDVHISFSHHSSAPRHSREGVRHACSTYDPALLSDLVLLVSELVSNVVMHTRGGGSIDIWHATSRTPVRIEVSDRSSAMPLGRPADLPEPGGRGLVLIGALSADWGFRPTADGKVVWAELRTPSS